MGRYRTDRETAENMEKHDNCVPYIPQLSIKDVIFFHLWSQ